MTDSTPDSDAIQLMERLAQKLSSDANYLANILFTYRQEERISEAALAQRLSLEPTQLIRLALCKRPQTQSTSFAAQIRQIAAFTGANETVLAQIVRHVEVLQAFDSLPPLERDSVLGKAPASSLSGVLAAARDHTEPEDDAPIEEEEPNNRDEK
jgi:hypothetical protein